MDAHERRCHEAAKILKLSCTHGRSLTKYLQTRIDWRPTLPVKWEKEKQEKA